jgi:hypothetical protein
VEFRVVPSCPAAILLGTGALQDFGLSIRFEEQALILPGGEVIPFMVMAKAAS